MVLPINKEREFPLANVTRFHLGVNPDRPLRLLKGEHPLIINLVLLFFTLICYVQGNLDQELFHFVLVILDKEFECQFLLVFVDYAKFGVSINEVLDGGPILPFKGVSWILMELRGVHVFEELDSVS